MLATPGLKRAWLHHLPAFHAYLLAIPAVTPVHIQGQPSTRLAPACCGANACCSPCPGAAQTLLAVSQTSTTPPARPPCVPPVFPNTKLVGACLYPGTLAEGDEHVYRLAATGEGPLAVSLVWVDPPADPVALEALVNDLDLEVVLGGPGGSRTTTYLGNGGWEQGGGRDTRNNVERVGRASMSGCTRVINLIAYFIIHTSTWSGWVGPTRGLRHHGGACNNAAGARSIGFVENSTLRRAGCTMQTMVQSASRVLG